MVIMICSGPLGGIISSSKSIQNRFMPLHPVRNYIMKRTQITKNIYLKSDIFLYNYI